MHHIMKTDSSFARVTWSMQKRAVHFVPKNTLSSKHQFWWGWTGQRGMQPLHWLGFPCCFFFFSNNSREKTHILPVRQNKQMCFKVYQGALLLNTRLSFMYNYFPTETAFQTRQKIWSRGTSRPFVYVCGNEGGFWNKICYTWFSQRKWTKDYGALHGLKNRTASDELWARFSRSTFVTNFCGPEWGVLLHKQFKTAVKTIQHHTISSYFTSQSSLPALGI